MKKLLLILVMLFWCSVSVGFAGQQQLINQHLEGRKLETIEGVWISGVHVSVIFKQGGQYIYAVLEDRDTLRCGEYIQMTKLGENYFRYTREAFQGEQKGPRTSCGKRRGEVYTVSLHVNNITHL